MAISKDYNSVKKISVKWELITNLTNNGKGFHARFIIDNHSNIELANNWKLFFNIAPRIIIPPTVPQAACIEHINGDWFQIVPAINFSLKQNKSTEIHYRGIEDVIKESDGPLGVYFVFYNEDGSEDQIVEVDCEVLPFTKSEQINRNTDDQEPIPSAEYRYHNNQDLSLLLKDKLLRVIPSPIEVILNSGTTLVDEKWTVSYKKNLENEAQYLIEKIHDASNINLRKSKGTGAKYQIVLNKAELCNNGISKEAYTLDINKDAIQITGSDAAGIFYGVQSLLALIPLEARQKHSKTIEFEQISIQDAPRFGFRGLHTDVVRNFQTKETVFRILDIISFYKLNTFYIYLSDDEGWRLEIPGLPELTEIGGQRKHTSSKQDAVLHPAFGSGPNAFGSNLYGSGFFSKNDFIEILKYAKARHILVIPGINFPGHARSAIKPMEARYKRLMAEGKVQEANEYRLIDPDDKSSYCSAQYFKDNVVSVAIESTYVFYKKVITEIALMYKAADLKLRVVHTGGDEVPEGAWTASPLADSILKYKSEYKDPKNLQAYFFKRLLDSLKKDNYIFHGWEEVALLKNSNGSYNPNPEFVGKNFIPDVWNNLNGDQDLAYRIANAGYDIVLCPASNFYLDVAYDKSPEEPGLYWPGFVRTRDAWTFAPYDIFKTTTHTAYGREINRKEEYKDMERLRPEARKRILGLQAQLWSETIKGRDMLEYYLLPKLTGFAERAWARERDWESIEDDIKRENALNMQWNVFANTLAQSELPRYSYLKGSYNYRIPLPGAIIEKGILMANIEFPGLELRFTTDGSEPTVNSIKYINPINVNREVRMKAFDSSGKSSRTIIVN